MNTDGIKDLLKKIHDGYGFDAFVGTPYFEGFLDKLSNYSFSEIFAFQAKKYTRNYIFSFLLSTPSLWVHLTEEDWIEVINSMNPRPYPLKLDFNTGCFADIHFLVKYVRVNAIELFLRQDSFSELDKNYLIRYCYRDKYSLLMDEIDLEDLDGKYFMSEAELRKVQFRLISSGFNVFDFDEDDLISYITKKWEALDLSQ